MTGVKNAQNQTYTLGYDLDDNLLSLTPPTGATHATTWQYDAQGRLARKDYANGTYETYTYLLGRLASERQANGRVRNFHYNEMSDLVKIDEPNIGSSYPAVYEPDQSFTYNALGQLSSVATGYDNRTMTYDVLGRLLSETSGNTVSNDVVSYAYDGLGRLASTKLNGAYTTSYNFDDLGRLGNVVSPQGTYTYSYGGKSDLLNTLSRPDGSYTNYSYETGANTLRRLTGVQNMVPNTSATVPVSSFAYVYGSGTHRDARVQMTRTLWGQPNETVTYGYDNVNGSDANTLDQLTSEVVSRNGAVYSSASYGYNDQGNRISSSFSVPSTGYSSASTYTVNGLNQLTNINSTTNGVASSLSLTYDLNGNLTRELSNSGAEKLYHYDTLDRVVQQQRLQGGVAQGATNFYWDALGRLKNSQEYGAQNGNFVHSPQASRVRLYAGMDVLAERDDAGTLVSHYTRAANIGGVLGMSSYVANTYGSQHLHYDGSGNVASISQGGLGYAHGYDAWGKVAFTGTNSFANGSRFGYSTKE